VPAYCSAAFDDELGELASSDGAIINGGNDVHERQSPGSPVNRAAHLDPLTLLSGGDELGRDRMCEGVLGLHQLRNQSQVTGQFQRRTQRRGVQASGSVHREITDREPSAGSRVTPVEQLDTESMLKRDGQRQVP